MKKRKYFLLVIIIIGLISSIILLLYPKEENDLKGYYDYDYIGTSTKKPENLHLDIETSNAHQYFVCSADNSIMYKIEDGSSTVSQIVNKTYPIVAMWYDTANEYVYYVYFNEGPGGVVGSTGQLYIDLSDDSDHSVRAVTATSDDPSNTDTFIDGNGDYWLRTIIDNAGNRFLWMLNTGVGDQSNNMGASAGRTSMQTPVVVIGGYAWFLWAWSNENVEIWKWECATGNFTEMEDLGANTEIPSSIVQRGIVYDGSDIISFVVYDSSDSKYYLWTYVISTDTATKGVEFNVSLMMDRNNHPTSGACNEFEKAYGTASKIAYQFTRSYTHLVKIYDFAENYEHVATGNIQAITDNYVVTADKEIYKVKDITDSCLEIKSFHKIIKGPIARIRSYLTFAEDQVIKLYDDSDNLTFEGIMAYHEPIDDLIIYHFRNLSYSHLKIKVSEDYSSAATALDVIAKAVIDNDDYLYYDATSIPASGLTTETKFVEKPIHYCLSSLAEKANGTWYIEPDGKVSFRKITALTDSGVTKNQDSGGLSYPIVKAIDIAINQVIVFGKMDTTGLRIKGTANDLDSQKIYGIVPWVGAVLYPEVTDSTVLGVYADQILANTSANYPKTVGFLLGASGFLQVGETMNFQFTLISELSTATDYPILSITYDHRTDISTIVLSNGLLTTGGYGSSEIQRIENLERDLQSVQEYLEQLGTTIIPSLAIGSANAMWCEVPYVGAREPDKVKTSGTYRNVDATDTILNFRCSLPVIMGSYDLYINTIKIRLNDADAGDYIDRIYLRGIQADGTDDSLASDLANYTAAATITVDCSDQQIGTTYESFYIRIDIVATNADDLDISFVKIEYYYA